MGLGGELYKHSEQKSIPECTKTSRWMVEGHLGLQEALELLLQHDWLVWDNCTIPAKGANKCACIIPDLMIVFEVFFTF